MALFACSFCARRNLVVPSNFDIVAVLCCIPVLQFIRILIIVFLIKLYKSRNFSIFLFRGRMAELKATYSQISGFCQDNRFVH